MAQVSYFLTRAHAGSTESRQVNLWTHNPRLSNGWTKLKMRRNIAAECVLGMTIAGFCGAVRVRAQDRPAESHARGALTAQARQGENLFLQRCSLCHLPRKLKFGSPPVIGPSLAGQFKDATPEQMKVLRGFILKGGPDMPGFRYGFDSKEIEDLIAYLKTL